ncbi:hypothetical protein E4U41_003871, partial [Claviceps citrina]
MSAHLDRQPSQTLAETQLPRAAGTRASTRTMAPSILPISPAKLLSRQDHLLPGQLRQTTFFFQVPLDYADPCSPTIQLHARRVARHERPIFPPTTETQAQDDEQRPYMIYLEGGPGFGNRGP